MQLREDPRASVAAGGTACNAGGTWRGTTLEGEHLRLQAVPSEEAKVDKRGGAVMCADTRHVPCTELSSVPLSLQTSLCGGHSSPPQTGKWGRESVRDLPSAGCGSLTFTPALLPVPRIISCLQTNQTGGRGALPLWCECDPTETLLSLQMTQTNTASHDLQIFSFICLF